MILKQPFSISPSLLPSLMIGNGWLEVDAPLNFRVLLPNGSEYEIEDFRPGAAWNLQDCFSAVLSFLSVWHEAMQYGKDSENYDLFDTENEALVEWVDQNSDEITMLSIEIEETDEDLILP
jgi:hypothetical protein